MLQVNLNSRKVGPSQTVPLQQSQGSLTLAWSSLPNALYTVSVFDKTVDYLHLLVVNVPGTQIEKGTVIAAYQPPDPPSGSGVHNYDIKVYQQSGKIGDLNTVTDNQDRYNVDLDALAKLYNLSLVAQSNFLVSAPVLTSSPASSPVKTSSPIKVSSPVKSPSSPVRASSGASAARSSRKEDHSKWIKPNSGLTDAEQRYARCVLQVAGNQPPACLEEKAWGERREGKVCANPYPVCAKSVGTTTRRAGPSYNFEEIPDVEVRGYARLNKIPVPEPYDRQRMLNNIKEWKVQKGYQ